MKVLDPNSPLHFLPKEIKEDQLMIFDSFRFTLEMIDYNYEQLENMLLSLSEGQEQKLASRYFNYALGLIDHTNRFIRIYKVLNNSEDSSINKLNYIKDFRDNLQHLHVNINQVMIPKNRPIFGILKWVYFNSEKQDVFTGIVRSGIYLHGEIMYKHHAEGGYHYKINNIILDLETRKKKKVNELNLSQLILDISSIVVEIDELLHIQFQKAGVQLVDWRKRKDVFIRMQNPKTGEN